MHTTIAITGAAGFLGRHLVRSLSRSADVHIRQLVHQRTPDGVFDQDRVTLFRGDLLDRRSLEGFVRPGDTVVNLAFLSGASQADNLKAATNLAEACIGARAARLIHCSSAVVVGRNSATVVDESTPCEAGNPYEAAKLAVEETLRNRCRSGVEIAVLRPTVIFGPGGRNLIKLANDVCRGNRLLNYIKRSVHGTRRMNAVGVDNVIAAIEFLIRANESIDQQIFIVSDDEYPENNYGDILRHLRKHLAHRERALPPLPVPDGVLAGLLRLAGRSNRDPRRIYDSSKLSRAGFMKPVSFAQSLIAFTDWYQCCYLSQEKANLNP